jgi:hypothetical protein
VKEIDEELVTNMLLEVRKKAFGNLSQRSAQRFFSFY